MDAVGKDSSINLELSGINPQGVAVTSFKQSGPEALAHDFIWRVNAAHYQKIRHREDPL